VITRSTDPTSGKNEPDGGDDNSRITSDQILQVSSLIRSGITDDLVISIKVGVPEEQVARFRKQGLGCPLKRKPIQRRRVF
jgi:hypothetical protein